MDTVTTNKIDENLEERVKSFEREKNGLIGDLAKQREKNRVLEERLNVLESSLNEPEPPTPSTTEAEVQKFTQDPIGYIRNVTSPLIKEEVDPIRTNLSLSQMKDKLDDAMEYIADEEGITKKEAKKRYDETLAKIVGDHGFRTLDPYDGTLAAYKIMKTENVEKETKEEERDQKIKGEQPESSRHISKSSSKLTTSMIANMPRSEYERRRVEILEAAQKGLITRD